MSEPKTAEVKVVPCEPTDAMMSAGMAKIIHGGAHLGLKNAFKAMLAASPPAETGEAVAWRSGDHAPSITRGTAKTFVVTVFRADTKQNHTFAAEYLNAMELDWDEDGDTRMATKTGWFLEVGDGEDFYRPLTLGEGDKFLGWTHLPVFGAATHPASDQSDTERMRAALVELRRVFVAIERRAGNFIPVTTAKALALIDAALAEKAADK